jgi:4'-phosphopantetheinyl transferase
MKILTTNQGVGSSNLSGRANNYRVFDGFFPVKDLPVNVGHTVSSSYFFDLQADDVHFYYACLDEIHDPLLLDHYGTMLTPPETCALNKITSERKRHESLVTRALARFVLAGCCGVAPKAVQFFSTPHGKPGLLPGVSSLPVQFNLSHCQGLVGCAVTLGADIGLDMEDTHRKVNMDLAGRFFSPLDIRQLEQAGDTVAKQDRFVDLWTLKEAYVKAVGKGLSLGLDQFSFFFDQGIPKIRFAATGTADPGTWHFFTFTLLEHYKIAVGVSSMAKQRPVVNIHGCIPFKSIQYQGQCC